MRKKFTFELTVITANQQRNKMLCTGTARNEDQARKQVMGHIHKRGWTIADMKRKAAA